MSRVTRMVTLSGLLLLLVFALSPDVLQGRSTATAPSLPAPSGTVVKVSTESQLQAAVRKLSSNSTIVLAPGTYTLSNTLSISGTLRNIAIRGGTDNADDVVLVGPGMANPNFGKVPNGLSIGGGVDGVLIANLTVRDVYRQAVLFNTGTENPHVYNVHLIDAGGAFVRSNADPKTGGANNGVVEYSVIEYSTAARDSNAVGIDIHGGTNWIVRHNLFRNIVVTAGEAPAAALLARDYTTGTIADGNRFLNCARAIAFGFEDKRDGSDHTGGLISNNFIYRASDQRGDVAISIVDSPATKVLNNTVFLSGTYSTPIEYRFSGSTAVVLANNLLDGFLFARDGATGTEQNNLVGATTDLFVDAAAGNLHLVGSATAAIDHGVDLPEVTTDSDGDPRSSPQDIGADEYQSTAPADALTTKEATTTVSAAAAATLTVTMTAPASGATVSGTSTTVTASAIGTGILGVQFKLDGVNLNSEETEYPYSISWDTTKTSNGSHTLTAVARNSSGLRVTAASRTVTVLNTTSACPCSIWPASATPARIETTDRKAVELGVRFRAKTNGVVTGLRFYKGATNTGTHVGTLWSNTGTKLATATFTNETSSGWQKVTFSAPVAVTANTVYVASYHTNVGQYAVNNQYFATTGVSAFPLEAPANGVAGANGVYIYGASAFPTQTYQGANYWVDVVFSPSSSTDTTAPTVSVTSPTGGATVSGGAVTVSASASDNVGVVGVRFKLDGANLGVEDTSSPYSISWNTSGVTNGTHTLTAVARDAAGNSKTSTAITITVKNTDTTAPTVSVTSPAGGATVSGTAVTISGTATDNVQVVGVQFKVDGVNVGAEDVSSPYSVVWNTTALANGTHTVTAVARDTAGNSKVSGSVSVTVSNAVPVTPTTVIFQKSPDHANILLTGYKLEIFANGANPNTATAVASLNLGKPTPQTNGDISVDATSTFKALPAGTYVVTVGTVGTNVARSAPVTYVK